jgi:hypothetical protein
MRLFHRCVGIFVVVVASAGVSACGGGGSGSSAMPVASGTPPAPILVTGATYQYAGTESVTIVYANPTATNVNSTGTYAYTASQSINASAAGLPAPFDVNRVTTYTVTQSPASGELLTSQTADTYENQTFAGATETLTNAGSKTVTVGVDLNAGLRLGSGPFNETSTATTTYSVAATIGVFPLQTGASFTEPLARSETTVTVDANGAGTYGGGGTTTTAYNNDGSFTRNFSAGNSSSVQQQTVSSNGTATLIVTPAGGATTSTGVGTPSGANGTMTIPVTVTTGSVVTNDAAIDWYPGANQPQAPLAVTLRTVPGPVALPASCAFSGTPPPIIEMIVTTTNLDPLGSNATSTEQVYEANGISVCHTQTSTTTNYTVTTGAVSSTTTTTIAESLVSTNQTITGVKRTAGR